MKSLLQQLIGLEVINARVVFDYLQVFFAGGIGLNVYNKYNLSSDNVRETESSLVGAALAEVVEGEDLTKLRFSNGLELSVDMSYDGYLGPEAMQLIRPGLPTVIWRTDG